MTRVAMVSAGLHGIGWAITGALITQGYQISASTTQADVEPPDRVESFVWDLHDAHAPYQWIRQVMANWHRIDVLVNNVGPYLWDYPRVAETDRDDWNFIVESNLTLAYELSRHAIPIMRQQGGGAIINIGYVGAGSARGWKLRGAYSAAKSGLASLTRTIAIEEQSHGISCTMICPSDIRDGDKEVQSESTTRVRLPTGHDVARLVTFLADPASMYLSGNVIELAPRLTPGPA